MADASKFKKAFDQCAKQQTRIIGGEYTAFREYPWMVSSLEKNKLLYDIDCIGD